jgi:hypothetical protein
MAEAPGHHGQVLAVLEYEGRVGVPQIVEALPWQPSTPQGCLELVRDVAAVQRRTTAVVNT